MRDVVMRHVPTIFGGNTLYATCALAVSGVTVIFYYQHPTAGLLVVALAGTVSYLLARWRGWVLLAADAWSPARGAPVGHRLRWRPHVRPGEKTDNEGLQR